MAAGCAVGPDYARPPVEEPSLFKSGGAGEPAPTVPTDWWRLYGDPDLDRLIASVHASNQTLRQAVARVDQARALARVAGSFLYPTISVDPSYSRTRYSGNRRSINTGQKVQSGRTLNDYRIPFDLTYEIDVWSAGSATELMR